MNIAVPRDHHHVKAGLLDFDLLEQSDPVDLRHPDIQENETWFFPLDQINHTPAIGGVDDAIAFVTQDLTHRFANPLLIVDDENSFSKRRFFHSLSLLCLRLNCRSLDLRSP